MGKSVVIHQPDFMPYIGFFHRFLKSDLYVVLDNVQYSNGSSKSLQNRDKVKGIDGEEWLTICVQKTRLHTKINEVLLSKNVDWKEKNIAIIKKNYKDTKYFSEIWTYIEKLYQHECEKMMDFNLKSIEILMELFDVKTEIILASTLNPQGKSNELIVDILKKVNANTYISGVGAKDYYDPKLYNDANIKIIWQDFKHPIYPQLYGTFMPYLSSIDLLFNCGIEESRKIIRDI